jgi:hypothetical protein
MWKQISETEWRGTKGREDYKILMRSIGRGKYTYHGYFTTTYIANGNTLDQCKICVDLYIKAKA